MQEKEIRDRIARFLRKTARTVVVPASVGLGLSGAGCNGHPLQNKAVDAGRDLLTQNSDVLTSSPDLADAATMADLLTKDDLPLLAVPYVVAMFQDAADAAPDAPEASGLDAEHDVSPVPLDVRSDIIYPPPPYLALVPYELGAADEQAAPSPVVPAEKP